MKEYKKATDIQEKAKKQIQRDLDKKIKAVKGFGLDELAINGIDLAEAVAGFNPNDIEEAIDNIVAYCKQWATREGVSYELAFAKIQATFTKSFEDLTSQFVYGKHIKSAMKAIAKLSTKTTEESLIKNAKNLAKRFAEFLQKETADFAKKKLKKEAEKTEKRLNELKAKAVKIIVDFANDQKLPKANVLDIKREIPARVQAYLAQIKKVITLSEEEVKAQYQQLSQKAGANDENGEEAFNYKDRFRMSALMTFGNIKEKSLAEILSAYNELKKLIQGEKDKQLERIEKMEEEAAAMVEPLVDALKKRGNLKDATENIFKAGIKGGSMYNHALENVFLSGKGMSKPLQKDVKSLIERYTTEISHASLKKRNFVETKMQWLRDIVAECYGSYAKGLERLTRFDEKLSRFAKDEGDNLSIARLMNIYCAMQQWHVKQAYKNAKNKKTSDGEKIDYTFEKRLRYWENLYKNEAEIEKVFTDADKKFIEALKGEYAKRFQQVNSIYEKLNGLPMVSYDGANYMPIKRDMGVGLGGKAGRYIRIFPRYYAPRIVSLRELDEQESILDIFNDRVQTDAHFINFAEIAFKYLSAMENDEFNDALKRHTIGSERDKLLTFTRHILNGEIESEYKGVESLMIRLSASVGLGMNLPSQFKQFSGVGAFMLEQSIPDFVKGFVGTIATPEGWESIKELWSSPYLADRRNSGQINWVLSEFEKQADSLKNISSAKIAFKNVLSKAMFGGLKYMDSVASVVGGASLYRAKKEQYMQTMPVEKAKELATLDVVAVAERTQQSSLIMNMGEIQRNKGAFGKMFTMFRTTNQQFLSYETNAITKVVANPTTENVMNLARTLVANHLISPIFFNSLGLLAELILGDDLDEDDWELFLKNIAVSVFLDVFTGWYITGIAKDVLAGVILGGFHSNKSLADSMLPAGAVARVVEASMRLMRDLADGNGDFEFWKHIDRMLKTALPIWRTGRKIYDNATDDKDSVLYSWAFK